MAHRLADVGERVLTGLVTAMDPSVTVSSPRISVLIPCWNAVGSIGRALDSVLRTTDPTIECIVVDDASIDGTADVPGRHRSATGPAAPAQPERW
jgi:cellulose synthase/poly-beta-1,6-N-acetylglucosamine synthase-like glycosyltransferase